MRIAHVINNLQVGGAEVLLKDLAPGLRDGGNVEVEIIVLCRTGSYLEQALAQQKIRVIALSESGSVYSPRHVLPLMRCLRDNFDLVHVQLFPAQLWVAIAARLVRLRTPLVTSEQNTHNRRRRFPFRPLDRWMYARYGTIVAVSAATAEALVRWLPSCRSKVRVIHNAVDGERFAGAEALHKSEILGADNADAPLILCVGRLEPQKDHDTLLRAMPQIPGAHLALVGDGVLRSELEALAESLGIRERVHFLGRRSDVPALIKAADVYVQSSRWEGWCIAVLEAMAGGAPIVASRAPGLAEAVEGVGRLFPPGDWEALAAHVNDLLAHPEERARLGGLGRAFAGNFGMDRCVEEHLRLYEEITRAG